MTDDQVPLQATDAQKMSAGRSRKVLLVGATGFLGRKILRHLEQDETVSVRAMSRTGAPVGARETVEWVRAI